MSILNRLGLNGERHLDDAALAEIWTASIADRRSIAHPHLASCADCRARAAAYGSWLDGVRTEAHAQADHVFPAERLAAQQTQILRRLEALERPARVIAFPRFARPITSTQGNAQRWIAAAAAAGLVIGLAAGQFLDFRRPIGRAGSEGTEVARLTPRPQTVQQPGGLTPTNAVSDETLLYEGDGPQSSIRVRALQPMDDITPRARDLDRPR